MYRMWSGLFPYRNGLPESVNSLHTINPPSATHKTESKTSVELTSLRVHQLLEKRKYQKIVELLRELPHHRIQRCLESFPFKALNRAVPDSFPIWETLLSKLHNNEEGYIPQFPYAACDELVIRVAQLVLVCERDQGRDRSRLLLQCRRVLKQVYMQYHEVLDNLMKENERLSQALYSLGLHIPLGTDHTAISLQRTIKDEVNASLVDFQDGLERLEELLGEEILTLSQMLIQDTLGTRSGNGYHVDFALPRQMNQMQMQERLQFNQRLLHSITPCRRKGNLTELLEMLNVRIQGDKEVLAIYAGIRQRNEWIADSDLVEPWLRRYQQSIEYTITILREIEVELAIKSPPVSPHPMEGSSRQSSPDYKPHHLAIPNPSYHSSNADSPEGALPPPMLGTEHAGMGMQGMDPFRQRVNRQRSASLIEAQIRPSSAALVSSGAISRSSQSIYTVDRVQKKEMSVSAQDIPSILHSNSPLPPAANGAAATSHSGQAIAGVKKKFGLEPLRRSLRNSLRRLSGSTGSMNSKSKKRISRTSSGGDTDSGIHSGRMSLEEELDMTKQELLESRETIQALRRRERELTDRLSEQAQRHLQDSDKFEDILLGASRPTQVAQRYQELYSQSRVEAYDAIECIQEEHGMEDRMLISEFLLDALKFAYKAAQCQLSSLHQGWKRVLVEGPEDHHHLTAVRQLESAVSLYLKKNSSAHNPKDIIAMAQWDLEKQYGDHPLFSSMMELEPVICFLEECSRLGWDLVVQSPPMVINVSEREFVPELHTRFFTAKKSSPAVLWYLWPTLMQSSSGGVLFKGVVIT